MPPEIVFPFLLDIFSIQCYDREKDFARRTKNMDMMVQWDGKILLMIQQYLRQDWLTPAMRWLTHLADKGWLWIALAVFLLFFKKTRKAGVLGLCALAVGFLITNVALKNLVARPRPWLTVSGLTILIRKPTDYSFPSGHTCASFAAALSFYKMLPNKNWGIAAIVLATLIAFSRLYLGVHYPTDVIGGFVIAFLIVEILSRVIYGKSKR